MGKIYMVITNQKIYKGQQTHTSAQTIIVFITLIQKKKPLVTQKMQRLKVMLHKLRQQCKATRELKEF